MDDSSLFAVKLTASLQSMDAAWRSAFIDHEKLRKQVKKIVFIHQEHAQAVSDAQNASQSPHSQQHHASLIAQHQARTNKYHNYFHAMLQKECQDMNAFFLARSSACSKLFDELGLDHAGLLHQQVHPIATFTFAKVLMDTFPQHSAHILSTQLQLTATSTPLHTLEPRQIALFKRFLHLCYEIDQLRKYVLINHMILWKVIKKYDKHTRQDSQKGFLLMLKSYAFSSEQCSALVSRAQFIANRLLQVNEHEENLPHSSIMPRRKQGTCPICLRDPMVDPLQLACGHSMCFACLLHQPSFGTSCPCCRKEQEWDAHLLGIESVLSDRIAQIISVDMDVSPAPSTRPGSIGSVMSPHHPHASPLTAQHASPLTPASAVANALNTPGIASALPALPPMLQQVVLNAINNAAMAAVAAVTGTSAGGRGDTAQIIQAAVNSAIASQLGQFQGLNITDLTAHAGDNAVTAAIPYTPSSVLSHSSLTPALPLVANSSPKSFASHDTEDTNNSLSANFRNMINKALRDKKSHPGVSCHQCKTTKENKFLHFCCNREAIQSKKGKRRKCRKKFCDACLKRSYDAAVLRSAQEDAENWCCPSCLGLCICAACHRADDSDNNDDDTDGTCTEASGSVASLENASSVGGASSASSLQRQFSRALKVDPTEAQQLMLLQQQQIKQQEQIKLLQARQAQVQSANQGTASQHLQALMRKRKEGDSLASNDSGNDSSGDGSGIVVKDELSINSTNTTANNAAKLKTSMSSPALNLAVSSNSATNTNTGSTLLTPSSSELPALEVLSPPSSACSKASNGSSLENNHYERDADVADDRGGKQAKRFKEESPTDVAAKSQLEETQQQLQQAKEQLIQLTALHTKQHQRIQQHQANSSNNSGAMTLAATPSNSQSNGQPQHFTFPPLSHPMNNAALRLRIPSSASSSFPTSPLSPLSSPLSTFSPLPFDTKGHPLQHQSYSVPSSNYGSVATTPTNGLSTASSPLPQLGRLRVDSSNGSPASSASPSASQSPHSVSLPLQLFSPSNHNVSGFTSPHNRTKNTPRGRRTGLVSHSSRGGPDPMKIAKIDAIKQRMKDQHNQVIESMKSGLQPLAMSSAVVGLANANQAVSLLTSPQSAAALALTPHNHSQATPPFDDSSSFDPLMSFTDTSTSTNITGSSHSSAASYQSSNHFGFPASPIPSLFDAAQPPGLQSRQHSFNDGMSLDDINHGTSSSYSFAPSPSPSLSDAAHAEKMYEEMFGHHSTTNFLDDPNFNN